MCLRTSPSLLRQGFVVTVVGLLEFASVAAGNAVGFFSEFPPRRFSAGYLDASAFSFFSFLFFSFLFFTSREKGSGKLASVNEFIKLTTKSQGRDPINLPTHPPTHHNPIDASIYALPKSASSSSSSSPPSPPASTSPTTSPPLSLATLSLRSLLSTSFRLAPALSFSHCSR